MSLHLLESGTQALALAILACRSGRDTQASEVIVPAYGCPDLVSACLFAGVTPRLVDVAADHWAYDRIQLERSVSERTLAVLAVNLLGIGDDHAQLQRFAASRGVALIADSAQHIPRWSPGEQPQYTVLSFGRGKPANALRGGMLVARDAQEITALSSMGEQLKEFAMSSRLAAIAFNAATHPRLYGYTSRLPGLGVGATTFKPLTRIKALPASAWRQVGAALIQYNAEPADNLRVWRAAFDEWSVHGLTVLRSTEPTIAGRHLRLPLLAQDRDHRDRLIETLQEQGHGATHLYGAPLPQIAGVPEIVARQGPFPNASRLADRLLTLPTHAHVTEATVQRVSAAIRGSEHA
ncbi:MAG TPA: DegT/DnrJ/EryC1/StrS family aminotransferase [Steroidobacter sp.]|uniref:DegT/DnrJ/EryC1/StrS family aminotransferase n=1 Tax=Steroidobacter sp. TaxID=1978227 RepID=UPI002EDB1639